MHKIIKEATGDNIQMERLLELKNRYHQDIKYSDKTFETIYLAKNNAQRLFLTEYERKYFFYYEFIPWRDNDSEEKIKKESNQYFKQIKPENSVIIIGMKFENRFNFTCNDNSSFYLNCSYFMDENNYRLTNYYNVLYVRDVFNDSNFLNDLDSNFNGNINFTPNTYISRHHESFIGLKTEESIIKILESKNKFIQFYFKRNTKYRISLCVFNDCCTSITLWFDEPLHLSIGL